MILLRHGQSEFNLHFTATKRDPGIKDPVLTALGHAQAERAAEDLMVHNITRIVSSPYRRALQTAAPFARRLGLTVQIHPGIRERFHFTCDVGSPRLSLAEAWPSLDFSHLDETWWPTETESIESVSARADSFRVEMQAASDWPQTLVVSHWAFILALTGHSLENGCWLRFDPTHASEQDKLPHT
jgi:broad specificity phosphatase PhoE